MIAGVRQRDDLHPMRLLNRLADSLTYAGHPYGMSHRRDAEASLASSRSTQLREYQAAQIVTSRMLLVVVGNIDRARLEQLVAARSRRCRAGRTRGRRRRRLPGKKALAVREAALPTNYILGYYPGPPARDPTTTRFASRRRPVGPLLHRDPLAAKSVLCVDAPFIERAISTGGVYVTTVDPNATLRDHARRDQSAAARADRSARDSSGSSQQFITEYYLKNETNADQANFLARAAIYQGDYRAAERFVNDLRRVRPEDIRQAARTYMKNFSFAYVGDPSRLDRSLIDRF